MNEPTFHVEPAPAPVDDAEDAPQPANNGQQPARVISVTNQKGGVGKTTTTVSLAAALAELDIRTLVVDLDPQGNATTGLGLRPSDQDLSVYHVLVDDADPSAAVRTTEIDHLWLLPSSLDLAGAEIELVSAFSRESKLKTAVGQLRSDYDVVLVDCPPSLGLLTINALTASDQVVVPIQCEYYALEGLGQLMKTVELVRRGLNAGLELGGVILTMYDGRTNLSQQVVDEVRNYFGEQAFNTIIPRTVRLSEAPSFGQPITLFDTASRGARAYRRLASELAKRLGLAVSTPGGSALDRLLGQQSEPDSAGPADTGPEQASAGLPTDLPLPAAEQSLGRPPEGSVEVSDTQRSETQPPEIPPTDATPTDDGGPSDSQPSDRDSPQDELPASTDVTDREIDAAGPSDEHEPSEPDTDDWRAFWATVDTTDPEAPADGSPHGTRTHDDVESPTDTEPDRPPPPEPVERSRPPLAQRDRERRNPFRPRHEEHDR